MICVQFSLFNYSNLVYLTIVFTYTISKITMFIIKHVFRMIVGAMKYWGHQSAQMGT